MACCRTDRATQLRLRHWQGTFPGSIQWVLLCWHSLVLFLLLLLMISTNNHTITTCPEHHCVRDATEEAHRWTSPAEGGRWHNDAATACWMLRVRERGLRREKGWFGWIVEADAAPAAPILVRKSRVKRAAVSPSAGAEDGSVPASPSTSAADSIVSLSRRTMGSIHLPFLICAKSAQNQVRAISWNAKDVLAEDSGKSAPPPPLWLVSPYAVHNRTSLVFVGSDGLPTVARVYPNATAARKALSLDSDTVGAESSCMSSTSAPFVQTQPGHHTPSSPTTSTSTSTTTRKSSSDATTTAPTNPCGFEWIDSPELLSGIDSLILVGDSTLLRVYGFLLRVNDATFKTKVASLKDGELHQTIALSSGRLVNVSFIRSLHVVTAISEVDRAFAIAKPNSLIVFTYGSHDTAWLVFRKPMPAFRASWVGQWPRAYPYWQRFSGMIVSYIAHKLREFEETYPFPPPSASSSPFRRPVVLFREQFLANCAHPKYAKYPLITRCRDLLMPTVIPQYRATLQQYLSTVNIPVIGLDSLLMGSSSSAAAAATGASRFRDPPMNDPRLHTNSSSGSKSSSQKGDKRKGGRAAAQRERQHVRWVPFDTETKPLCHFVDAGHINRHCHHIELQLLVQAFRSARRLGVVQGFPTVAAAGGAAHRNLAMYERQVVGHEGRAIAFMLESPIFVAALPSSASSQSAALPSICDEGDDPAPTTIRESASVSSPSSYCPVWNTTTDALQFSYHHLKRTRQYSLARFWGMLVSLSPPLPAFLRSSSSSHSDGGSSSGLVLPSVSLQLYWKRWYVPSLISFDVEASVFFAHDIAALRRQVCPPPAAPASHVPSSSSPETHATEAPGMEGWELWRFALHGDAMGRSWAYPTQLQPSTTTTTASDVGDHGVEGSSPVGERRESPPPESEEDPSVAMYEAMQEKERRLLQRGSRSVVDFLQLGDVSSKTIFAVSGLVLVATTVRLSIIVCCASGERRRHK